MTFQKGLNIPKKVYTFQKSLNKTPFYGSPHPREGNPPGKHTCLNALLRKNDVCGLQTTFFDGFNVLMSFLAEK